MDVDEASRVLGIAPGADPVALRSAYRRRILAHHPDLTGHGNTAAAARIIEAYTVLRRIAPTMASPPVRDRGPTRHGDRRAHAAVGDDPTLVTLLGDDTIAVPGPADVAVRMLLDAAHDLGEVTYVDLGAGLVQLVVTFEGGPVCLLLLTVGSREHHVEAHLAVDSLDMTPPPPVVAVLALLADVVRRRTGTGPTGG